MKPALSANAGAPWGKLDRMAERKAEREGMPQTAVAHPSREPATEAMPAKTSCAQPVVAIIQARMGSSRLPGKSLAEIEKRPMLWHVIDRVKRARLVDRVVVATSVAQADDAIE